MKEDSFINRIHRKPFRWYHIFIFPTIIGFVLMNYAALPLELILYIPFFILMRMGDSSFWFFFFNYFVFIAVWTVLLAYCGIVKISRPVLKALWRKVRGNTFPRFLLGLLIGGGLNFICAGAAMLNGDIHLTIGTAPVVPIIALFLAVLIQSGAEEALCRGFLYQKLIRGYKKPWIAIVWNSLFFSMLHIANPGVTVLALIDIFLSGLMFSFMTYYLDSIWCAIGAHTAWNFMQSIILGLPNSGIVSAYSIFRLDAAKARNSIFYNVGFGVEGTIFSVILLVIACAALFLYGFLGKKKPTDVWREQIDDEFYEIWKRQQLLKAQQQYQQTAGYTGYYNGNTNGQLPL